jgi:hypothetical protein
MDGEAVIKFEILMLSAYSFSFFMHSFDADYDVKMWLCAITEVGTICFM